MVAQAKDVDVFSATKARVRAREKDGYAALLGALQELGEKYQLLQSYAHGLEQRLGKTEKRVKRLRLHVVVLSPFTWPFVAVLKGFKALSSNFLRNSYLYRPKSRVNVARVAPIGEVPSNESRAVSILKALPGRLEGFTARARQLGDKPRIIILSLAHLGDFIVSLRAFEIIRNGFPDARISIICAEWNAAWAHKTGFFDEIVTFEFFTKMNREWAGPNKSHYARFEELGLGEYDLAIDLRHDIDTRPCLYRISARFRAGFWAPHETGYPPLDLLIPYVERVELPNVGQYSMDAGLRLELLASAVVCGFSARGHEPILRLLQNSITVEAKKYAVLALSAGDPIRYWSLKKFSALAKELIKRYDLDIVLLGGVVEKEDVHALAAMLPEGRVTVKVNMPLAALPDTIAPAAVFVGHGTGVTHLSAKLGVPTVALLAGVSPLDVWHPVGQKTIVLTGIVPCSPCGFKTVDQCGHNATCLSCVEVSDVLEAISSLIVA